MEIIAIVVAVAAVTAVYFYNKNKSADGKSIRNADRKNLFAMTKPELIVLADALGLDARGYDRLTKEMIVHLIKEKRGY